MNWTGKEHPFTKADLAYALLGLVGVLTPIVLYVLILLEVRQ